MKLFAAALVCAMMTACAPYTRAHNVVDPPPKPVAQQPALK
jgi:hypothetical protein